MNSKNQFFGIFSIIISFIFLFFSTTIQAQNCQGTTYTQGGWGAPYQNHNLPAPQPQVNYLYTHFSSAFPNGLMIGCSSGNWLKLTSAADVTEFLPSGGEPLPLNGNYTNPTTGLSNTLAGQLVSITLAVVFDQANPSFSPSNVTLGNQIIASGPFSGKTVNQFLLMANNFIGNCGTSGFSASTYNETATAINENYDNGTIDNGFLKCCLLQIHAVYEPIKCHGGTTIVHITATGGSVNTTGTGDFEVSAGTHTFTVQDGNCTSSITLNIGEPVKLNVVISGTPILCYGGSSELTSNATGGTGAYHYLWSTGETTQKITVLASPTPYSVTVTDDNGCTATDLHLVTQPNQLTIDLKINDVMCVGGTAAVTATVGGGTQPYTITWTGNGISLTGNSVELPVGSYTVKVVDANGCTISKSFEVKLRTCGDFTTVTQGGWGAKAAGNNWGTYRDKNFAKAFPTGLSIGYGSRWLKLTSAKAVDDFLPSGTTPRALNPGTLINPGGNYRNVFAGQVVALTLNVGFDNYDSNFSVSSASLGDLIVVSGTFAGMSVNQVLAEANKVLGGEWSMYSPEQMNNIVDAINNNFDDGKVNGGLLACPCNSETHLSADATVIAQKQIKTENAVLLYPNPSNGEINLSFEGKMGEVISVQLYNYSGKMIADLSNKAKFNGKNVSVIYSNSTLQDGLYLVKVKTSTIDKVIKLMVKK